MPTKSPGPVPKRSSERRRRNKESRPEIVTIAGPAVQVPPAAPGWHEIAAGWYEALAASGQAKYFEPSDWAGARFIASELSAYCKTAVAKRSAVKFAALWAAMNDLLTTEGERRRVRIEIDRDTGGQEQPASVTAIADYRASLGV